MKPSSIDERRQALVAEFERTNEELRALKLKAQRLQAELGALKDGSKKSASPLQKPSAGMTLATTSTSDKSRQPTLRERDTSSDQS